MDRRTILAVILIMAVAILPSILFPPKKAPASSADRGNSATPLAGRVPSALVAPRLERPVTGNASASDSYPDRTVTVESRLYRYQFSTRGGRLIKATLKPYRSFAKGDDDVAQIVPDSSEFLEYRVVLGSDTVNLADWDLQPSVAELNVASGPAQIDWSGRRGGAEVTLHYRFVPDNYLFNVTGDIRGLGVSGGLLLIGMGPRIRMVEADSLGDLRLHSLVTKGRSAEKLDFRSLEPGERRELAGPFEWVAVKSKYFLTAVLTLDPGSPQFGGVLATGGARSGRNSLSLHAIVSLPAPGGLFSHQVYVGPQEYRRLSAIGHGLNDVNPYGWAFFRPIIQPVSVLIMQVLLWMHQYLLLSYGWVVILFGVGVRLALWPLNQKAMRSGMAMQAIQPELKALQDRYKKDPQRLQQEMMKLYREHGVNPLGGCLPMLIPMPVLFAVWFVLANTIEFRGVPFLWLPDLARADPLYIIPIASGVLMYLVTKVGQIGMPPNPQTTMMLYMMPIMFTFMFLNLAAGVSLYYAAQNIASLPQQWMVAQQRLRRVPAKPPPS
jgi:YidC/Oxa1 family membrane protein insertase